MIRLVESATVSQQNRKSITSVKDFHFYIIFQKKNTQKVFSSTKNLKYITEPCSAELLVIVNKYNIFFSLKRKLFELLILNIRKIRKERKKGQQISAISLTLVRFIICKLASVTICCNVAHVE